MVFQENGFRPHDWAASVHLRDGHSGEGHIKFSSSLFHRECVLSRWLGPPLHLPPVLGWPSWTNMGPLLQGRRKTRQLKRTRPHGHSRKWSKSSRRRCGIFRTAINWSNMFRQFISPPLILSPQPILCTQPKVHYVEWPFFM